MLNRTIGHYRILEKLGEGGMGVVFLAQDARLHRNVALKLLTPDMARDPERLRRFEREAKVVASLSHPNIVTLYSVEEEDGETFLTMEYVEGETLESLVPREGLPSVEVLRLGIQLADAVAAAHQRGISHRDLKPSNVIVTPEGRVKVLDFGLAKLFAEDSTQLHGLAPDTLTREGNIVGTLAYMSPERLQGKPADARADVFALGVLFYEMVTGTRPFQGCNSAELISAVLRDQPAPLRRLKPELPGSLGDLILRCLDKNPATRLQSAAAVRDALESASREFTSAEILRSRSFVANLGAAPRRGIFLFFAAVALVAALWGGRALMKSIRGTTVQPAAAALPGATAVAAVPVEVPAIAVLPLRNYNSEPDYFVDGMTDGVISALARIGGVRVISRQSAMHYKGSTKLLPEIARELGVSFILEGSVERSSGIIRLSVSLLRADPEAQVWSSTLERPAREVFPLQADLAQQVARAGHFPVSGRESARLAAARSVAPEVYELYLQGNFTSDQMTDEGLRRGQASYEKAIAIDPTFAPAYAALADDFAFQGYLYADPVDSLVKAERSAQKALELDSESAEAHASLAYIRHFFHWDWTGAEAEYRRAIELNVNYAPARRRYWALLEVLGRHEEAGREIRRALEIDPLMPNTNANFAMHLLVGHQYDEALRRLDHTLELWPHDVASRLYRWQTLELLGRSETERRAALQETLNEFAYGDAAAVCARLPAKVEYSNLLLAVAGDLAQQADHQRVLPTLVAELFYAGGDRVKALDWLERGIAERSPDMADFMIYPRWSGLAGEERYRRILERLSLPAGAVGQPNHGG
ncbi:MAG: protein kinase [Acidobacteriota bacterium]